MFILLALILTFIAISLRLGASGLELADKVVSRKSNNSKTMGVAKMGVATSILFMRVMAFIISRIRDLISFLGSFIIIIDVIVLVVVIVASSSALVLFTDVDESGQLMLNSTAKRIENTVTDNSKVETSEVGKPVGLSEESWAKADAIGKSIVAFASNSIINPPNGTYLLYQQGNTPVGYADCSVFVCAVFEGALKKTFTGLDAPNGYDFAKNKKSDLVDYVTTYGMEDVVYQKPESKIGTTRTSIDSALPGDILLTDGHVGIYVGKNENGDHVMVHASTSVNPTCSGDIALTDGKNLEVGFSRVWGNYDIIRPSILLGY